MMPSIKRHRFSNQVLGIAAVSTLVAVMSSWQFLSRVTEAPTSALAIVCCVSLAIISLAGFFVAGLLFALALFLPISRLHLSLSSLLVHFAIAVYYRSVAIRFWRRWERATKRVREEQDAILMRILRDNADTEYGRKRKFSDIKNREQYRARHPFCSYEPFREYIDRMVNTGETNLLTVRDVCKFNITSGATGKSKLVPAVIHSVNQRMEHMFYWHYLPFLLPSKPYLAPLKRLPMYFTPNWRFSPSGLPIGPATVYPPGHRSLALSVARSTPEDALVPLNESAQTHLHWLFALYDTELSRIDSIYGGSLVTAMEYLGKHWQELCNDVRRGRITENSSLQIPFDVLQNIEPYLWPDPKRADQLEAEFGKGLAGVLSRVWPRMTMNYVNVTGCHSVYAERLRYFLGPNIEIYSSMYASSEMGVAAFNMNHPFFTGRHSDDCKALFTFIPNSGVFFEFIPLTRDENDQIHLENPTNSVFMDELQIGRRYEVAITSDTCGFYRYRMGDIVEVVDFHNQSPIVDFCARVGNLLDVRGEKITEDMVCSALEKCVTQRWTGGGRLVNYTSTESGSVQKVVEEARLAQPFREDDVGRLFYVIFAEVVGLSRPLTNEEALAFDEELKTTAKGLYVLWRNDGFIASPKVLVVSAGTFDSWKIRTLNLTSANSTLYKTPRYIRAEDDIRFLLNHVVSSE